MLLTTYGSIVFVLVLLIHHCFTGRLNNLLLKQEWQPRRSTNHWMPFSRWAASARLRRSHNQLHSCCLMKVRSQLEACLRWMVDIHVNTPSDRKIPGGWFLWHAFNECNQVI